MQSPYVWSFYSCGLQLLADYVFVIKMWSDRIQSKCRHIFSPDANIKSSAIKYIGAYNAVALRCFAT